MELRIDSVSSAVAETTFSGSVSSRAVAAAPTAATPAASEPAAAAAPEHVAESPVSYGSSDRLRARLAAVAESQMSAQRGIELAHRAGQSVMELQHILAELGDLVGEGSSFDLSVLRADAQRMINAIRFANLTSPDGSSLGDALRSDLESSLAGRTELLGGAPPESVDGARALVAATRTQLAAAATSAAAVHSGVTMEEVGQLVRD